MAHSPGQGTLPKRIRREKREGMTLDDTARRLTREAGISSSLRMRNAAEAAYHNAYMMIVKQGKAAKLRGKYRRS